jgi:hypothetical protein
MKYLIIIIIGIFIFFGYRAYIKKEEEKKVEEYLDNFLKPNSKFVESVIIDEPESFGFKNLWFAVKAKNKEDIANILKLKILGKSNWKNGVAQAYDNRIFITPEINGWTLICGNGLLTLLDKDSVDVSILNTLSTKYGEAQYFYTHRIPEYHIWAKSLNGNLERYYSYIGEQGENLRIEGEPTEIEKGMNLVNTFSKESKNEKYFDDEKLIIPDESLVMKIAKNWSIDPTELEKYKDITKELGIVCEIK